MSTFDKKSAQKSGTQPSISHLFAGITKAAAKGLRFEFSELDEETGSVEEQVLVYTPVLSLLKLRFKKKQDFIDMPKVQFETSRDSIFNQLTASAVIRAKLPSSTLKLLEETNLDAVDPTKSYFALKWQY